ncbi:hypothetical protein GIS00_23230 [Nakamurella sp. YIM 132087]|uniref:HlyD family efflux transporter periplasmic adaptor subunit n=1 Tax=Nakamurella alba TaxID=2665158 RepID=A0A7K1FRT5_9ACTN|nr:hypothetical protein [Nakamurella alba]MTD16851.1 hypothetical protein [Nakamurella alba]
MTAPAPSPAPGLFRPEAIAELDAGSQLEKRLRITGPRSWIVLVAALVLVLSGTGWAVFGRTQVTVDGAGAFLPPEGLLSMTSPFSGTVTSVPVLDTGAAPGEPVQLDAGDVLLTMSTIEGEEWSISAPTDSVLVNRAPLAAGTQLVAGTPIAQLLPLDQDSSALLFVDPSAAPAIAPGMTVHLSPATAPSSAYGEMLGTVRSVGILPSTESDLTLLAGGNVALAAEMGRLGTLRVEVELQTADTPSGFAWTSAQGPPFGIDPTTVLTGSVQIGSRSPISYLLGG